MHLGVSSRVRERLTRCCCFCVLLECAGRRMCRIGGIDPAWRSTLLHIAPSTAAWRQRPSLEEYIASTLLLIDRRQKPVDRRLSLHSQHTNTHKPNSIASHMLLSSPACYPAPSHKIPHFPPFPPHHALHAWTCQRHHATFTPTPPRHRSASAPATATEERDVAALQR